MGSVVISEVVNDTHPWSNMIDARAHHSDRTPYDPSYRASAPSSSAAHSPRRRTSSNSSRPTSANIAPSSRSSQNPAADPSARTPSGGQQPLQDTPLHQTSSSAVASSPLQDEPPPQRSPRLSPSSSSAPRPQTSHRSISPPIALASSTGTRSRSQSPQPQFSPLDSPPRIRVRDLQHIQSFAGEDLSMYSGSPGTEQGSTTPPQYEISDMPIGDIIEMVAGLLTKITTTNDQHHDQLHRQIPGPEAAANLSPTTSSVLAFHGKNVPSITILSYLSRIHKYCPATWEVFLSLLVYFDRMTERVNAGPIQSLRQADQEFTERLEKRVRAPKAQTTSPANLERAKAADRQPTSPTASRSQPQEPPSPSLSDPDSYNLAHFFVVDSFNIHRLVIAGVTCAAKYFSDIFFTNSRYAKVGGLPLVELNHLELQFLLLNDFRLAVPVEELEAYATMLVEFYAREVVAQRQSESMEGVEMVTR